MFGVCRKHSRPPSMNFGNIKTIKIIIPKEEFQKCDPENTFLPNLTNELVTKSYAKHFIMLNSWHIDYMVSNEFFFKIK